MNKTDYMISLKQIFVAAIVILLALASCNNNNSNYFNPTEALAKEAELRDFYYKEYIDSTIVDGETRYTSRLDTLRKKAIDIVKNPLSDLLILRKKIGTGDSIKNNNRVSYRYELWFVADSVGKNGRRYAYDDKPKESSNKTVVEPRVINVVPDATTVSERAINEAVKHMKFGGECKIIFPSTLSNNRTVFRTTIMKLRITSVE